ncbi:amidophosphoribosyltransferase [Desulfotomaculum nigrificans CO-1-SRB]|uniref:Amidophosphoribosyltransferase n=1 Tax=Desulfotomaculum nigrificans (strain DSM 14880 / VKM B-2319 / CO-1-SRB) TaxID=868595 RepID=F6B7W6_DESCC|nr:amidophosphoribosyltransferase [Desulfotomaculum nigrificans]AEF94603.1 amidophosphoribosyltransferase [Desulfotomaculum nigrificans CO-1-SRB]
MFNEVSPFVLPDKPVEECGVFGIYGPGLDVARLTYYGLYALQHRGQESAGIAVADGRHVELKKGMGLVPEVFTGHSMDRLTGHVAIGHVRYSTTGASQPLNAQPLVFRYAKGMLGLAHNGNLTNVTELKSMLASTGSVFQSSTDSEVLVNLIARYNANSLEEALMKCMIDVKGAYSLLIITEQNLYAARDPHGFRPLCLGRLADGYVVASESCALTTVGATFIRDVEPGEIIRIDQNGITSTQGIKGPSPAHCIFEYIYFARPDSTMDGFNVNRVRREMGRQLAREYPVDADIVIPVPDSGIAAARGYAEESGIPFEEGLMKNRYIGRTFIQPTQQMREIGVRLKLSPIREVLNGKRVVLVDDSIVRGTTSQKIVAMLREAGAREVHLCISSPPVIRSCYFGIDTSDEHELIAAQQPLEEIRRMINADGLHYLSLEGLLGLFNPRSDHFCTACFDGRYPVEVPKPKESGKFSLE